MKKIVVVLFPETNSVYRLRSGQPYFVPIKDPNHPTLVVAARVRAPHDNEKRATFVTLDEYQAEGIRKVVLMKDVDQTRPLLTYRNNKTPCDRPPDKLWFPETRRLFKVRHNYSYRVPIGKNGTLVDVVYKRGLGQSQGTFLSVNRHPKHKLHYTINPADINQTRSILSRLDAKRVLCT